MQLNQHTLAREYAFEGKGLHTGTFARMTLKPAPAGLHLEPCLPAQWPECGIVKRFRGTTYDITFRHEPGRACNRVASLLVDGAPHDPAAPLPLRPGATLHVEAILKP